VKDEFQGAEGVRPFAKKFSDDLKKVVQWTTVNPIFHGGEIILEKRWQFGFFLTRFQCLVTNKMNVFRNLSFDFFALLRLFGSFQ